MSDDRNIIKNLEDALKIVDDSDIPPAPATERPFPLRSNRSESIDSSLGGTKDSTTGKIPGLPLRRNFDPSLREIGDSSLAGLSDSSFDSISDLTQEGDSGILRRKPSVSSLWSRISIGIIRKRLKINSYKKHVDGDMGLKDEVDPELDTGPPKFKIKFDFESAYRDVPDNKPIRLRREKRTGLVGGLLLAIFIICVSVVLASVVWMATVDVLGFASEDEQVNIQVPSGFTLEGIADMLYESGLIRHRSLFILYAEYSDAIDKISEGSYILNKNYDYRALVQGMTARAGVRVETTVTIPEGFTLAQIFSLLENEQVCPAADLWEAATYHDFDFHFLDHETLGNRLRLEGFLFPDTYNFYMDSSPVQAILRMLREFNRRFTEEYVERAGVMGFTVREIIIVASIIEREAGDDEERPRIAAVIFNRLDSPDFPRLEIDATIHYALAGTGIPFSTDHDSPFNTYTHEGFPPGPISNPGIASIQAALFPETTNEYYYALNRDGTHNFFTNYTDHVNFVNSDEYGG